MIKLYNNGEEFLNENINILNEYPVETSFFRVNAKFLGEVSKNGYAIRVNDNNKYLLCLYRKPYNLLLFGFKELSKELTEFLIKQNLEFENILAPDTLAKEFMKEYSNLIEGSYKINLSMDIMTTRNKVDIDTSKVIKATKDNLDELAILLCSFSKEALNEELTIGEAKKRLLKDDSYLNYYFIKEDNKIVAMAKATQEDKHMRGISCVYTIPSYRNKHYSYNVVGYITNSTIDSGKISYLYVDKNNPISNHLYKSLGYDYIEGMTEIHLEKGKLKKIILAGGCFWCMAKPYYEYDGIKAVYSGYTGGLAFNPKYEEVKSGTTGHKEAVMLIYDSTVISYNQILDIYFDSIDPFDGEGQFIDRGDNYACTIYTSCEGEKRIALEYIKRIEEQHNKTVYVPVIDDNIFYMAEEYHQDYSIKNPEAMEEELISSGRKNK